MNINQRKFIRLSEAIFEVCADSQGSNFADSCIPLDHLLLLIVEAENLKISDGMSAIPAALLVKLISILEKNVQEGLKILPFINNCINHEILDALWAATNAALAVGYIMTSKNVPKQIYFGSSIKSLVLLIKFQLENTIYPTFDSAHLNGDAENKENIDTSRKKQWKAKSKDVEKHIRDLYLKLNDLLGLITDLVEVVVMSDDVIASLCMMGLKPFFIDGIQEVQVTSSKLVMRLFKKYQNCRSLMLDHVFRIVASISGVRRNQRTYIMDSNEHVMMFTAVIFDLVQSVVWLPDSINFSLVNADELVLANYKTAMTVTASFLALFLNKSMNKTEEKIFRPLLDNFVQDLITTLHKPEWPVAEMMISQLGRSLIANFTSKHLDAGIRATSLEILGLLAALMREDEMKHRDKFGSIDLMLWPDKMAEEVESGPPRKKKLKTKLKAKKDKVENVVDISEKVCVENYSIQEFHGVLLKFLTQNPNLDRSRCFHIIQWYRDTALFTCKPKEEKDLAPSAKDSKTKGARKARNAKASALAELKTYEANRLSDQHKEFLILNSHLFKDDDKLPLVSYEDFVIISHYVVSKKHSPSTRNFEIYLQQTISVMGDSSIQIRTKALRSLRLMVDADPTLLSRPDVKNAVDSKSLDSSPSVREATMDFIGKFVTTRPKIFQEYYDVLSTRILDTSLAVRKRIVRIFRDVCVGLPTCPYIPQICLNMMGRLNDDEGIRRFVVESFEALWFTPVCSGEGTTSLQRRVFNITASVNASSQGHVLLELLLTNLFAPRDYEDLKGTKDLPRTLMIACQQIVDELIKNALQSKVADPKQQPLKISCFVALLMFTKVKPGLLVQHFAALQHYLSPESRDECDTEVIPMVARTLELIIPLVKEPNMVAFSRLEADCFDIVRQYSTSVVTSAMACLAGIVKTITKNYPLVRDFFLKYYTFLSNYKSLNNGTLNLSCPEYEKHAPLLRRALFTIGLIMRHFDFTNQDMLSNLTDGQMPATDDVFKIVMFFIEHGCAVLQTYAVMALGNLCILNHAYLLTPQVKAMYRHMLVEDNDDAKAQVLSNLENYLLEEEKRLAARTKLWRELTKQESLKEMCDVSGGMSATIIQLHLADILAAYVNPSLMVRQAARRLIHLIVRQGLVHIASAMSGIKLSHYLQKTLKMESRQIVRGFVQVNSDSFEGANDSLYALLRTNKQQRRTFALSMLKSFDEMEKNTLFQQLYLADNLAYFTYHSLDEPMFIIYHISVILSISGNNVLDDYRQAFTPLKEEPCPKTGEGCDDEGENVSSLANRVPDDLTILKACMASTHGCLLLLCLKQHLKQMYGITDIKMHKYSPTDSSKAFEKPVTRRNRPEFKPEATLQVLQSQVEKSPIRDLLDWIDKQTVAEQFLDFKQLMEETDPTDMDSIAYADERISGYYQMISSNSADMEEPKVSKVVDPPVKTLKGKRRQTPVQDASVPDVKVAIPRVPAKGSQATKSGRKRSKMS